MALRSGVRLVKDDLKDLVANIQRIPNTQVLVGVPEAKTERKDGALTNAALAMIHDRGAPDVGIPARPFMRPGMKAAQGRFVPHMGKAARAYLDADQGLAERHLNAAGIIAADSIRSVIQAGIPPELKPATVRARRRRSKGSSYRRKAQTAGQVTALIDTAQMLRSVTHVVRKKR